ncbi:MAG: arsenate reductase family protein [Verrucomicrobiae bacterium]|nr:arsenate reductase family protein [Verrucomicrobiae bacterium]
MLKVYAYAGCDTCRRALRFLRERNVVHEVIPIREQPPSRAELRRMLAAYGGDVRRLFNTSGQDYKALGLARKLPDLSTDEALALLAGNGNLVKRPFVLARDDAWTGFKEAEWRERV